MIEEPGNDELLDEVAEPEDVASKYLANERRMATEQEMIEAESPLTPETGVEHDERPAAETDTGPE